MVDDRLDGQGDAVASTNPQLAEEAVGGLEDLVKSPVTSAHVTDFTLMNGDTPVAVGSPDMYAAADGQPVTGSARGVRGRPGGGDTPTPPPTSDTPTAPKPGDAKPGAMPATDAVDKTTPEYKALLENEVLKNSANTVAQKILKGSLTQGFGNAGAKEALRKAVDEAATAAEKEGGEAAGKRVMAAFEDLVNKALQNDPRGKDVKFKATYQEKDQGTGERTGGTYKASSGSFEITRNGKPVVEGDALKDWPSGKAPRWDEKGPPTGVPPRGFRPAPKKT